MTDDASTQPHAHAYAQAVVERVADALPAPRRGGRAPWLIGLSGLQGSGKSTLVAQLAAELTLRGRRVVAVSLDDFYLSLSARARLARRVHPLFATRGVPGTHDLALIDDTLRALARASAREPARVPRFDKGRDERLPRTRWRRVEAAPHYVLFEGWCMAVPAQPASALRVPVNALERDEDADAHWRTAVNAQLRHGYAALWRRLDRLVMLQAPSFDVVERWRNEQEDALRRAQAPRAMSAATLHRFIMHYERLSRWSLRALPRHVDLRLCLDAQRRVKKVVGKR